MVRPRLVAASSPATASRLAARATVSHGSGCRILDTWGANAGEAVTTSAVGPSATTSPSANTIVRAAASAASSTSWVATMIVTPTAARSSNMATSRALAG